MDVTDANREAWTAGRYDAWTSAYGSPAAEAVRIIEDPERVLRRLTPHLGEVSGRRICSVQGSLGSIAVALTRLGAEVLVVDFSEENRRYALELAAAAGVTIDYAVCDVMEPGRLGRDHSFDVLVLELGILH
jgi:2-polyprenyl-3-methyl-5-hydroxy-6-metoxy-1,4-benzoquinol methylase